MRISDWSSDVCSSDLADAVRDVILSNRVNYWTGQEGRKFEEEFAVWAETAHAIALANGTVALDLALRSEARRVGQECVSTSRYRWSQLPSKKKSNRKQLNSNTSNNGRRRELKK